MSDLKLLHPVHTLENQLLFPAGTELPKETLNGLILSRSSPSFKIHSLLRHGSVRNDLLQFFSQPPYLTIFADKGQVAELMDFIETINLAIPVLQGLDYFRERDFYTYRHSLMVFAMSALLAKDLITDYQDLIRQVTTGPTHDLGKICVPLSVLKKNTPLTLKERGMLAHHSAAGYVLLSYYLQDIDALAARVARDHHERKDGSGYPRGICLTDLMVEIIAVCDIYDALISPRPYRPVSYGNRTALEEITGMAERNKIRWEVTKALIARNRKSKSDYRETAVSVEKRGTPPANNLYDVVGEEGNTTQQIPTREPGYAYATTNGRPALHTHQGSNEQTQALRLHLCAADVLGRPDPALGEHSLQLGQIGGSERLVHPHRTTRNWHTCSRLVARFGRFGIVPIEQDFQRIQVTGRSRLLLPFFSGLPLRGVPDSRSTERTAEQPADDAYVERTS